MSDDFNGLHCTTCYYAVERYNRKGTIIGYDCGKDNMRFIDIDLANVMCCGAYAERGDRCRIRSSTPPFSMY